MSPAVCVQRYIGLVNGSEERLRKAVLSNGCSDLVVGSINALRTGHFASTAGPVQGSGPDSTVLLCFIMLVVEPRFPAANLGPGVEGADYCKNRRAHIGNLLGGY